MFDVDFFEDYIGKDVSHDVGRPGSWKVLEKVDEEISQLSRQGYERLDRPFAVYGTFLCENTDSPSEQVVMRVFLQYAISTLIRYTDLLIRYGIPHTGSAY